MAEFLRNLIMACIGLAVLIGALMASFFLGLALLVGFLLLWLYIALRRAGVFGRANPPVSRADDGVIEAEYVVIREETRREPEERA